ALPCEQWTLLCAGAAGLAAAILPPILEAMADGPAALAPALAVLPAATATLTASATVLVLLRLAWCEGLGLAAGAAGCSLAAVGASTVLARRDVTKGP